MLAIEKNGKWVPCFESVTENWRYFRFSLVSQLNFRSRKEEAQN